MNGENEKIEDNDFGLLKKKLISKLEKNPLDKLKKMILILIVSAVGSIIYSIYDEPEPMKPLVGDLGGETKEIGIETMSNGIGEMINAGSVIKETLKLESQINEILSKEVMTNADSIFLLESLDKFQQLNDKLHSKNTLK